MNQKIKYQWLVLFLLFNSSLIFSQSIILDDFENYNTQMFLCPQSTHWTTWSGMEGGLEDATVIQPFPNPDNLVTLIEGSNAFPDGGPTDLILKLGDLTTGKYALFFDMYIPDAGGGYYNFQHFEEPGVEWAFSVEMLPGGIINGETPTRVTVGGVELLTFGVERGKWVTFKHFVDLDNDLIRLEMDQIYLGEWQFSQQELEPTGTNQLGSVNFFPPDWSYKYYIDNIRFEVDASTNTVNIDDPKFRIFPNPVNDFLHIELKDEKMINQDSFDFILYDLDGRKLMEHEVTETVKSISTGDLDQGFYIYKILSTDKIVTGKIFKE